MGEGVTEIHKALAGVEESLKSFPKSKILEQHVISLINAWLYGNIISNFFGNLNSKVVKELGLPKRKIGSIKRNFRSTLKESNRALRLKSSQVNSNYYVNFKQRLKYVFPEFGILLTRVEDSIDTVALSKKIRRIEKKIRQDKKGRTDLSGLITTLIFENYIKSTRNIPSIKQHEKLFKQSIKPKLLKLYVEELLKNSSFVKSINKSLTAQKAARDHFEKRTNRIWKKPFDLLEVLIGLSLALGAEKKNRLSDNKSRTKPKYSALIRIHARSLIICK